MLNNRALAASASTPKLYVEDVFSTYLYTGNGNTQTITNGIDLSGKGGLVWIKTRSTTSNGVIYDTSRGVQKQLSSETTGAQVDTTIFGSGYGLTAFTSSGFTIGASVNSENTNNVTQVSWTFRKAAKFFDVVTWTAVGTSGNRRISHNLGSVPGCIIIKATNATDAWYVYHRSEGRSKYLKLNSTDASVSQTDAWGTSDPTSTDFGFAENIFSVPGWTYVAYLFAHDAGGFGDSGNDNVISCGSYTGNGSTSGPTVTLGWEPQWLLVKRAGGIGGSWFLFDSMRGIADGGDDAYLQANASDAETLANYIKVTSTGFQPTNTISDVNANGSSYIYIAIRRGPMKTPTDATKVFAATSTATAFSPGATATTGFPVDLSLYALRNLAGLNSIFFDRLRGTSTTSSARLISSSTAAEATSASNGIGIQSNTTVTENWTGGTGYTNILWNFRRAPGFFDVVAYTGNGSSSQSISHNLGVLPNLVIVKSRSLTTGWSVFWGSSSPLTGYMSLNSSAANSSSDTLTATSTSFTAQLGIGNGLNTNAATYIAYLFATCPGVSKVGSYTGSGGSNAISVDCGFTNGARFVLIKRTDSTGDWYVWDTARGIVSGNDNYLLLNSTAAEVTNTDYIDPYSAGFEISSTAPAAINANGGSFIYLAVA